MANVTAPRNGIPIGWATVAGQRVAVEIHPEYLRYFEALMTRVGGVTGAGTDDLALSQFEDAGVEEHKHALFKLADAVAQSPIAVIDAIESDIGASVEELREQVAELTKAVEALQQGFQI